MVNKTEIKSKYKAYKCSNGNGDVFYIILVFSDQYINNADNARYFAIDYSWTSEIYKAAKLNEEDAKIIIEKLRKEENTSRIIVLEEAKF